MIIYKVCDEILECYTHEAFENEKYYISKELAQEDLDKRQKTIFYSKIEEITTED